MPELAVPLPSRRPELVTSPLGESGRYVLKDAQSGAYFQLGEEEHFLLLQLDGLRTADEVCRAYQERFGKPLGEADLDEFLALACGQGFLQATGEAESPGPKSAGRHSLLYWRKALFDPDRLFTRLEPRIRFFWTRSFLLVSAGCILSAAFLTWANRPDLAGSFRDALRWETALLAWLTLLAVTLLHEFAHGLTCKHHGGEVHEIGFLMLLFMPCFYCNVSDAWLFREKAKRLWVTFAGGYFELFLWSLAVFAWRLTLPGTLVNRLAFVVLSVCGVQTLFNFNPLLKLDGYYLLSDWLEVPNLKQGASDHLKGHLRWLLWGAARPQREPRGRLLLSFGAVSGLYALVFLALILWGLFHSLGTWGWLGLGGVVLLTLLAARGLFRGVAAGEVTRMLTMRRKRTIIWLLLLGGLAAGLCLVEMEDRVGGSFQVRPAVRGEVRAPLAGFLKEVCCDEGDRVSRGALVARLAVPELASRLARKQAEVREAQARLCLLEVGPRPEEVAEQRRRVERAGAWRELARQDLARSRRALAEELDRLEKQAAAHRAELEVAEDSYQRARVLLNRRMLAGQEYRQAVGHYRVSQARLAESQAARRALEAKGALEAETELARRQKELADARAALRLLQAGSRPQEVEAQRARLARLREEVRHLKEQQFKQAVSAPVSGLVTTARLREKVGQYLREGELICVVEEPAGLEVEVAVAEQDVAGVRAGQEVALKARALPFATFATRVDRVAPVAGPGDVQSRVTVYCRLEAPPAGLQPGMTGYARVYTGRRPVGAILRDRALRYLRTEFWW
jgi:multidrug efflux pump subunit AcrA (membrane-fusion protein)